MKYKGTMLVVKNIEKSKEFYTKVLGCRVTSDFGENVTFTGGFSVQTEKSWMEFTNCQKDFFTYNGNVVELYFEEDNFEEFRQKVKGMDIEIIDGELIMPWGQKVIRFYDPDKHIVEVGENLTVMVKRLRNSGLSLEELVEKTFIKKNIIERMLKS